MKRSEINQILRDAKDFYARMHFSLPPWAFWSPEQWKGHAESEVVKNLLGWDLTDFGYDDFEHQGLVLFTIRNGNLKLQDGKPYAEKIMIVRDGQTCPMHFHWTKIEDIINRGGANLSIQLYGSTEDEQLSTEPVTVSIDGFERSVEAGDSVILTPGESITLRQGMYHSFTAVPGQGPCLIGEVSSVNDDNTDNRPHVKQDRFPTIEEDEAPLHLLVNDYATYV